MRDLALQPNVDGSDLINYPKKRIRNNSGVGDGTPVDESVYGDIHQTNVKFLADAKITPNGLPDNVGNGYQLYEAMTSVAGKNDLIQPLTALNAATLSIPIKIAALKVNESVTFIAGIDSNVSYTDIKGSDNITKAITLDGDFKTGQQVQIINTAMTVKIVGLYTSLTVPNLQARIVALEGSISTFTQKLSIFTLGGAMFIWNKPVNQIPAGYQEVTDMKGKTVFGFDVANPLFNVVGNDGGSATKTLVKANLPNVKLKVFPSGDRYGENGAAQAGFFSSSGDSNAGGATWAESEAMGSSTPMDVLNPYRIVAFIEWATV